MLHLIKWKTGSCQILLDKPNCSCHASRFFSSFCRGIKATPGAETPSFPALLVSPHPVVPDFDGNFQLPQLFMQQQYRMTRTSNLDLGLLYPERIQKLVTNHSSTPSWALEAPNSPVDPWALGCSCSVPSGRSKLSVSSFSQTPPGSPIRPSGWTHPPPDFVDYGPPSAPVNHPSWVSSRDSQQFKFQ